MGPRTEELEAAFSDYTGAGYALAVTNGTAALHLICIAAGLGPGDEVIVPSLTFVATVNAIRYTGATPVFADIAGVTEPWLAAAAVEAKVTERTRAVMHMPYGGHAGETLEIAGVAERRGLTLLEDAAHAVGGRAGGRHLGTIGLAGAFSFFSNKNLPAGEGGMVTTDDADAYERMRRLRSHGMTALTWDRHGGSVLGYDVVELGFNYRIDEPRAVFARGRLALLDEDRARRADHVGAYRTAFDAVDGVVTTMALRDDIEPAQHLFTVLVDPGIDRDSVRREIHERGVQTSLHYPPVHRLAAFVEPVALPISDDYAARAITLPLFGHMTVEQRELVIEAVSVAVGSNR